MRKSTIFPVIALSALTLGTISTALPAGASVQRSVRAGENNDDGDGTTQNTVGSGSGSGSGSATPSGGASTGGGGMAGNQTSGPNVVLWLVAGGAGLALIGTGAVARRRRTLDLAPVTTSSSVNATNH
jgi:hypothetical protein